jgi:hypothetical protein
MKNISEIKTAHHFNIGETYIEIDYYLCKCLKKGKTFSADFGTEYQEIHFEVTTKTGRYIGNETKKIPLTINN